MKTLLAAFRLALVLSVLTGLLYPLAVWAIGRTFFRSAAEGSIVRHHGRLVGSALLAQRNDDPRYFSPRPSAGDYATVASAASNLTWTSARLHDAIATQEKIFRERNSVSADTVLPADAITCSGSGLDPDLSPAAVRLQALRVATARGLTAAQQHTMDELIAQQVTGGHISPVRINVLRLNLALDAAFPSP